VTAVNMACARDGSVGFMLTDSALYSREGEPIIHGFVAKQFTVPHASAVLAYSGPSFEVGAGFCQNIGACEDFDHIRRVLPDILRNGIPMLGKLNPEMAVDCCAVYVMGYSASERAVRCFVAWTPGDYEAEMSPIILAPTLTLDELAAAGWTYADRPDISQLQRELLAVMNKQRECGRGIDGRPGIVGGCATLTTVTRHEITQRVIRRWPDVIGQPIVAASSVAA
jgi:hypothetical protein